MHIVLFLLLFKLSVCMLVTIMASCVYTSLNWHHTLPEDTALWVNNM